MVNVSVSITGRYPNLGPQLLLEAGIPVVDGVGPDVLAKVADGTVVRLDAETLYLGETVVAKGTPLTEESVQAAMAEAKAMVAVQIESFAANTLEFLRREHELLTHGIPAPDMETDMNGRHVLVVVRGYHYREDIAALRPYIREYKPVMVAVDGGADALIEAGYQPDAIFGDMDSVSDEALCCGAELVVHAYPDGRAPGLARVRELGLDAVTCPAPGTSEDVALLVADAKGASLIAVVGTHHTLEEFLDKGRPGMSSTFITHLRVAGKLVNARGVHQLYQSRISSWSLLVLVLAAAVTVFVAVVFSPAEPHPGQVLRSDLAFIHLLADREILVIDFRYHLVSIVAVFLALAIGIVLGSTELQGPTYNILNHTTAKLQNEYDQARSQLAAAQAQANQGESYAQAVEPAVLRDLLAGQRLLIVTEPGAQSSVVSGISAAAADAGASVTGQIALQPKFFDTSGTTQDSLNQTNLDVAQAAGIALANTGTYQQQAAQVIASEILAKSPKSARASRAAPRPALRVSQRRSEQQRADDARGLRRVRVPEHHRAARHPGDARRRRDPAERAVGRQRGPAGPGARAAGRRAGGQELGHRGRGLIGGLGLGQPDGGPAVEQRVQPGVHRRRRRPGRPGRAW